MKFFLGFTLLFCLSATLAFSQVIDRTAYQCNASSILSEYLSQDATQPIKNPEVLYDAAVAAYQVDDFERSKVFLKRIIDQKETKDRLIYYQAQLQQYFLFKSTVNLDSMRQLVGKQYGFDHEFLSVIDLVEADKKIRAREKIKLDSIIPPAISRIDHLNQYRYFISVSYQNLSKYYASNGKIHEGLKVAHELRSFVLHHFLPCSSQLSGTYISLGRRQSDLGELDSAAYYFSLSHDLNKQYHAQDFGLLSRSAENIANPLRQKGLYSKAIKVLKEAEEYAKKDSSDASALPDIYSAMGLNYRGSGNRNKAIEYFRKSILSAEEQSSDPSTRKLAAYFNIGVQFYRLKDYALAEKHYQKALELCFQTVGENHAYTASVLMSLGSLHSDQQSYDQWADYFERSLKIRKHLYKKNHASISNIYLNYALVYLDLENHQKAVYYANNAIDGYKAHFGATHPILAEAYLKKARIEVFSGNYDAAYIALEEGKKALGYKGNFKSCADPILYMDFVKDEAIFKLLAFKNKGQGSMTEILSTFEQALAVFQYTLEFSEEISDRSTLISEHHSLFDYYVEALVLQGEKSGDDDYFYRAYAINDKGKNLGLNEALNHRTQLLFSNVPKEKRAHLSQLKGQIKSLDYKLAKLDLNNEKAQSTLLDSLEVLQHELVVFKKTLKTYYPAFDQIQNASKDFDLEKIIPKSGTGLAIIDFRILDSTLISFTLSNHKLKVKRQKIAAQFPQQLATYFNNLSASKQAAILSDDVLPPLVHSLSDLDDDIHQIVIIPDKFLSNFPFEILEIKGAPLIHKYAVSYANSTSILALQEAIPTQTNKYAFTGFAPDYSAPLDTNASKLYAAIVRSENWKLPFARKEVEYITKLIPRSKHYLGREASKENLQKAIQESAIIHLSMHAQANTESSMNSQFIFNTAEENEDQNLLLYELYNMTASTEMVVLSACETGRGNFHSGDGVRSLGNGFLYAGVPSVVMTLWKVPDESTSLIMKSFYRFLKEGQSKSQALRLAKLDYLNQVIAPEQRHPYYWAGFILSGNDHPIHFDSNDWPLKTTIPFFLLFIALFWWIKRKRDSAQNL